MIVAAPVRQEDLYQPLFASMGFRTVDYYLVSGVLAVTLAIAWYMGDKKMNKSARIDDGIRQKHEAALTVNNLAYHGGFPPIPRPMKLNLSLCKQFAVLYTHAGNDGKVYYKDIIDVEKFNTLKKPDRRQSVVFWGPLALLFFREKTKHFITIKYVDVDRDVNHIVFETKSDAEMDTLYIYINTAWSTYKQLEVPG
jgi:hypothetical protein